MSADPERVSAAAPRSSLFASRTPIASVTCTHVAPICTAATCAWSSTSLNFRCSTNDRIAGCCTKLSAWPRRVR